MSWQTVPWPRTCSSKASVPIAAAGEGVLSGMQKFEKMYFAEFYIPGNIPGAAAPGPVDESPELVRP